jgi:predicted alpha-1,2-mannosidase
MRFALLAILLLAPLSSAQEALVDYPNPLQGTDSVREFSHGNLYPAIATPFPMNVWAPYTQPLTDSFYYQYRQTTICGIRQTHQPSPWINEYAAFAFMPVAGELRLVDTERACDFSHDDEEARPSYYRVDLPLYEATIEVTPTRRCASFRVAYGDKAPAYLVLDAFPGGSRVKILPKERKIIGISRFNHGGTPPNFANYFVVQFDQPFQAYGTWSPEAAHAGQALEEGDHVGAYLQFDTSTERIVKFRVASSFISPEQAEVTLIREIGSDSFETVRAKADADWNEMLRRVRVTGGTLEQRRTFYSALYRTMLFPHAFFEVDGQGKNRYFSPYDGEVHEGVLYTDSGLWDTFRAVHPLFNLVYPEFNAEILQGMLNAYEESGWLPAWASPGHRDCMIGNHAFSLFADAWVKGNRDFDAHQALQAIVHDASHEGPLRSIGREGLNYYRELGYLPSPEIPEATAKTLEFAYDDFCASVLARDLGKPKIAESFAKSSQNWRNVLDSQTGFVRGRKKDGTWVDPFWPDEWGGPFTEGNAWHWTWSVFHDFDGLIDVLGGHHAFARKLDQVFEVPPTVRVGSYGGLIHEMTEMIALNMGQYAHGNQPIQHMIYLYVYAGQPWKTQLHARQAMDKLYNSSPTGLCGDEDNGQTSAWYVFSAMGIYPVTPGTPVYILGSPLFDRVTMQLPHGNVFVIEATDNGPGQFYIQSATLNGMPIDRAWLTHQEIADGGTLHLQMGPQPNKQWASNAGMRPPASMESQESFVDQ